MMNFYKKFLSCVLSADKTTKNQQYKPVFIQPGCRRNSILKEIKFDTVEEYKDLKENISNISISTPQLAYQTIRIKQNLD